MLATFFQDAETTWWTATVSAPSLVVQGRTLEHAHARLHQALAALGVPTSTAVISTTAWPRPDLDVAMIQALKTAGDLRLMLLDTQVQLALATSSAVAMLLEQGMSYRKAGQLLGLSHARVEQIHKASARSPIAAPSGFS